MQLSRRTSCTLTGLTGSRAAALVFDVLAEAEAGSAVTAEVPAVAAHEGQNSCGGEHMPRDATTRGDETYAAEFRAALLFTHAVAAAIVTP